MDSELDDEQKLKTVKNLISRIRTMKLGALATDDDNSSIATTITTRQYQKQRNNNHNNNARNYETMSDGLAEILGDDELAEEELVEPEEEVVLQCVEPKIESTVVSKYIEESIPDPLIKEHPAIKLTFNETVSIVQLKRIQQLMAEHGSLCLNSTEIMTDRQLCVYFTESAAAWACLKWVHNSDENGEGLRKLDPGLTLITADFVSVSKWLADYDDYFTIRVAFDGLKNYHDKHIELFKTLSRFGDEPPQCIIIDAELKYIHVRYKKQYDAEIAISSIDRAYFFGSWCRATKAQPVRAELINGVNLVDIAAQKIHRKDVSIRNSNGLGLPRTSWKSLLTHVSEAGQVESLFGDGQGVIVSFKDLGDANRCVQALDKKKFIGKTLLMTKKFHIDQLKQK